MPPLGLSQRHLTGDYSGRPAVVSHGSCLSPVTAWQSVVLEGPLSPAPETVWVLGGFPKATGRLLEAKFLHKLMLKLDYVSRQKTRSEMALHDSALLPLSLLPALHISPQQLWLSAWPSLTSSEQ